MKKLVVISLMCVLLAATVYAQELKFDGYINSGLGIVVNDKDGEDPYFKAFGVDSESNGYRFRLNGSYTNEAGNAGARFRFQSQRRLERANTGYFSIPYAYGWVGFFDNKLTLTGGIIDDGTWTTADWWWNDDQGEGLGLLLKAEPIKGLNLGVGIYTISQQSGGSNNILSINNNGSLPNFQDIIVRPEDAKYTFNVAYTMPDVFRLGVTFRTKNRAGWVPSSVEDPDDPTKTIPGYTFDNYAYGGREEPMQLIAEARILAVKGLTAVVVGVLDRLDEFNDKGNITLSETFAFKVNDNLNIGLNTAQLLPNAKTNDKDTDPSLLFNLWGSYAIGSVVPRLDLVYLLGGQSKTVLGDKQWERKGFTPYTKSAAGTDDDLSVFSIRPSVRINLDSRTFLEIGDMINFDSGNYNGAYAHSGDANKRDQLTNVFYIDVKLSF